MCMMCDGYTEEEMLAHWAANVERDGWMPLGVEDDPGWVYTIGLRWSFDHPELIVTHPDVGKGNDLLHHAVEEIRGGRRFQVGSVWTSSCGMPTVFGAVHHKNLMGEWFRRWSQMAAACGVSTVGLRALQPVVSGCPCPDCDSQIPLDRRCTPTVHGTVGRRRRH